MRVKVKFGRLYRYNGVLFDRTDGHPKPREGQVVRVTRLPMAPKENVMGMCYVADKETGEFIGMVMTSSLTEHDRDS